MYTRKIETERLILRKFKKGDHLDMFNNWCSREAVAYSAGWPVHRSINDTKALLDYWINEYKNDYIFNWIIELKDGPAIGSITVIKKDIRNKVCEIGYNIGDEYWNNGYATEAIKGVIKYLFKYFDTITAECFLFNNPSIRVLEKNNFKKEGILRNRYILDNKKVDLVELSLLKEEYK